MKPQLYLLNGPLGAGKTTLLTQLLAQPEFKHARIIQNEFASTSIDTETLHAHTAEIQTIAGVCICCSTGDELSDALRMLAGSPDPVIIEATGVANSLRLVERLILSDALENYQLQHALFVLDAAEVAANPHLLTTYAAELQAADTVLLSKTDLITADQQNAIYQHLDAASIRRPILVQEGTFQREVLVRPSGILDYFAASDEAFENHDAELNFTILPLSADDPFEPETLQKAWAQLQQAYGLLRMKGAIRGESGQHWHAEATPAQCRITPTEPAALQLILIGQQARRVTLAVLQAALRIKS